jgi:hypothetical protein
LWKRSDVTQITEGLANGDAFDAGNGDDVAGASAFDWETLKSFCAKKFGDLYSLGGAILANPGNLLTFFDFSVVDAKQG